jgi:hypothetical protein
MISCAYTCLGSRYYEPMIAFFESPFEKFLYLDSDLVLWGNILKHINLNCSTLFTTHRTNHTPKKSIQDPILRLR